MASDSWVSGERYPPVDSTLGGQVDLAAVVNRLADAVIVADSEMQIRFTNAAADTLLGHPTGELAGQLLTVVIPERLRAAHRAGFRRFMAGGAGRLVGGPALRVPALRRDGSETDVELTLNAVGDLATGRLVVASLRDVGDRIALERQVSAVRYLRATMEVTARLQQAVDVNAAYAAVLPGLCSGLDWEVAALWHFDADAAILRCVDVWRVDARPPTSFELTTRGRVFHPGEGLPGRCLSLGAPLVIDARDPDGFPRWQDAKAGGLLVGLAFPLIGRTGPLGVVELFSSEPRHADEELLETLASIGAQIGQFLERMHAESELRNRAAELVKVADTLQRSLLPPHLPDIPGITVAARYKAGGLGVDVGGDFYDLFAVDPQTWAIVIGDVCGRGAAAATVTALARYTARAAAMHTAHASGVLEVVNQALLRHERDRPFLTAAYLQFQRRVDGRVRAELACAGHPLPYLLRPDGTAREVGEPGTLLGVVAELVLPDVSIVLHPGDRLLLYTDGLTEARDRSGAYFGEAALLEVLQASLGEGAEQLAERLERAVTDFQASQSPDDMALVVIQVN